MTLVFQECSKADQGSSGMRFLSLTRFNLTEGIEGFGPFIVGESDNFFYFRTANATKASMPSVQQ
jgi:hypothetical protein